MCFLQFQQVGKSNYRIRLDAFGNPSPRNGWKTQYINF